MAKVKYVGVKEVAIDLWYGSAKNWQGAGDVQEVTEQQAKRLCSHVGEFERVEEVVVEGDDSKQPEQSSDPELDADALAAKPIEKMTKDELEAYARAAFGKELDKRHSRKVLVDEVQSFIDLGVGRADGRK